MRIREQVQRAIEGAYGTGKWQRAKCPACFDRTGKFDRRGSLSYNPEVGYYYCWKCNLKGFVEGQEPKERAKQEKVTQSLPEGYVGLAGNESLASKPAKEFLLGRKIGEDIWKPAELGISLVGPMAGRVVMPVRWPDGELAGCGGRSWVKKAKIPYLYTKDFQRGLLLYNQKRLCRPGKVFVVEGVLDALYLYPDGVALLGNCSEQQLKILSGSSAELVILLDGDAWDKAEALALQLVLLGANARAVRLPAGLDPDDMEKTWIKNS